MKRFLLKSSIVVFLLLFFTGCSIHRNEALKVSGSTIKRSESGNHYYYFMKSRLHKKNGNTDKAIQSLKRALKSDPKSSFLKKELALLYLSQKDTKKGLAVIEQILNDDPEHVDALIMLGTIKQKQNIHEDAKIAFEKVISIDPEWENIYLLLGGLYMDENDLDNALALYQKMVKNIPSSYAGHFFLGKVHANLGNTLAAEKEFEKSLELKPVLLEPRFELLALYKDKKETVIEKDQKQKNRINKKIVTLYKEILEQYPNNLRAAIELGYYYHTVGLKTEATSTFKELGLRSIYDKDVIKNVVQLFVNEKKYDAAIIILEGMLAGDPDSSDIHFITGLTYYDGKKEKDKAIAHFRRVAPDSRFHDNAAVHIAFLYQQQGRNNEAITYLKKLIENKPDNVEFMLYLGSIYEEIGDFQNAEKIFTKGIDIDPQNTRLYYRLGVVYDKWGKQDESLEKMRMVIKLDPKDARALNYLGYTMAELGHDLNEAERLIKEALKHKPDDGYITDSLGWIYYKKKLYKEAVDVLKKAVYLVPDDPIILEHLGDAYIKINEKDSALELYQKSLEQKKQDKTKLENKIKKLKDSTP